MINKTFLALFFFYTNFIFSQGINDQIKFESNQGVPNVVPKEKKELDKFYKNNSLPIGKKIDLNIQLYNSRGEKINLNDYLGKKPIVLTLSYISCPLICSTLNTEILSTSHKSKKIIGEDFEFITVSFLANETPRMASRLKQHLLENLFSGPLLTRYQHWQVLTGDKKNINTLLQRLTFKAVWSEEQKEYFHPTFIYFINQEGKLIQVLEGQGAVTQTKNFNLALIETQKGSLRNILHKALAFCYRYDPVARKYVPIAQRVMAIGGAIVLVIVGIFLFYFWRKELARKKSNVDVEL